MSETAEYYRSDGVRITHDPFAPGMARRYGRPGETDPDGFDPYADSVGPGIYGGNVVRDGSGRVVIGRQYQSHNPRPGPVYDGTGYSAMSKAISQGPEAVERLLADDPALAHEVTTGGATPLHVCGMSQRGQHSVAALLARGADAAAVDTYGYTPLHRMASNNLPDGARALLRGGAAAAARAGGSGETPLEVAEGCRADAVAAVLREALADCGEARLQPAEDLDTPQRAPDSHEHVWTSMRLSMRSAWSLCEDSALLNSRRRLRCPVITGSLSNSNTSAR